MPTADARTAIIPIRFETLAADIETATIALEVGGFVVQSLEARNVLDGTGTSRQVLMVHAVHQDFLPSSHHTADAVGRALIDPGYFGAGVAACGVWYEDGFWTNALIAKFADDLFAADAASRAKLANGFLTPVKLSFQPMINVDIYSSGWLRFVGAAAAAGENCSIGGRTYEFQNTAGMPGAGDVVYDMQAVGGYGAGPWTAAQCAAGLTAMVNPDPVSVATALVDAGGTVVLLVGIAAGNFALATTVAGCIRSAATMVAGELAQDRFTVARAYTVTAADVATWAAGGEVAINTMDDPGTAPDFAFVQASLAGDFYSGAGTIARVAQVNANNYALLFRDPTATIAAGAVIRSGMIA